MNRVTWVLASLLAVFTLQGIFISVSYADNKKSNKNLVVFGDSLVDVGNLPPILFLTPTGTPGLVIPPPSRYDRGRFSNGPTVADYLATQMGVILRPSNTGFEPSDSVDFGHGGATTNVSNITPGGFPVPGVLGQVAQYLGSLAPDDKIDPRTLFLVWGGANDYLLGFLLHDGSPATPDTVVDNLGEAIHQLYERGGRKFLVFNIPDLGQIPICHVFGECALLSLLTEQHNASLKQTLNDMEAALDGISIVQVDAYKIFKRIGNNPSRFGFTEDWQAPGPAAGCLFQDPSEFDPANCALLDTFSTNQFFWDEQHPTTNVYKIIARVISQRHLHFPSKSTP